jgi:non-specific serine/threonine protein kinase
MIGTCLGRYRILEQIGAGGMGVVYRARDERLEREVAVKILPAGTLANEADRKRFRKEALVLSKLNHPNIATVHDFDTENDVDYLVMEYVLGSTLDQTLASGRLIEDEVRDLGMQLARGLGAAHDRGIVHRDLKPGNLRVTPDGQLKILDFGLARLWQPASGTTTTVTMGGAPTASAAEYDAIAGTVPYMAPEQLSGARIDARSDLFAAGVVLYEMATGKRPFPDLQGPRLIAAILNQVPPPPRTLDGSISPGLESIIIKALDKDPASRYQSAKELRTDLERLGTAKPLLAALPPRSRRIRTWALASSSIILLVACILGLNVGGLRDRLLARLRPGSIRAIAVLPFEDLSGVGGQEYFADGMTDELITRLSQIKALRVISRRSVLQYMDRKKSPAQIAAELHVGAVVTASVRRSGGRVRVSAQLIQPSTDQNLWADTYERKEKDILALQSELTVAIARGIQVALTPQEQANLARTRSVDPAAHEAYLKGRYYADRFVEEDYLKAIPFLDRAIEIDPSYAPAYAALAYVYWAIPNNKLRPVAEMIHKANAAVLKALELDPGLADAYAVLGALNMSYYYRWSEARRCFEHAIDLDPNSALAHQQYSLYLLCNGRIDESLAEIHRAEQLDPLSLTISCFALFPLNMGRRYDEAIAAASKVIELHPVAWDAYLVLGQAYFAKGECDKAFLAWRHNNPEGEDDPFLRALCVLKSKTKALEILEQRKKAFLDSKDAGGAGIAGMYAAIGDRDSALVWLKRSVEAKENSDLAFIKIGATWDSLRSDPRFDEIVRTVFPPE